MAGNSNSGRHRKSLAALKLHGQYRADRHGVRTAEQAVAGDPVCPEGLSPEGQWLWDFVVTELSLAGVTKRIDTPHLWAMCEAWGLYRKSVELAKQNPVDKDSRIAVMSYLSAFESAAGKCGLTPSDRAKLTPTPTKAKDEFAEFLNKKA